VAAHGLIAPALARARRPEKVVTLLLLFVFLTAATAGVTSILISPDWGLLWRGLTLGLLLGWCLAILRQPAWLAGVITPVVGAAHALLFASGLRERLSAILREVVNIARRIVTSPREPEIDLDSLSGLLQELTNASGVVIERVRLWIAALIANEPVFDPVAAALVWGFMVWLIAAWAGWTVERRRSALLASLPALLLSLGTLSYSQRESTTIYVMLGTVLLLLATVQLDRYRQGWEKADVAYPPRKGRQIGNVAVLVVAALVALSAIVSSISLPRLLEWVSEQRGNPPKQEGDLAKSLGILAAATSTPDSFEDLRRPGLPTERLIGSGPELSQSRVMTVEIEGFPAIFQGKQPALLYWRSFTYDIYTGHGWQTSNTSSDEYQADKPLQPSQKAHHIFVRQVVRSIGQKTNTVHVAGEAVTIKQPSEAAWRLNEDLFGIRIHSTAGYIASSLLPAASETTLRSAGQAYPGWVKQRYLQIPAEVPARVKDLAFQLTAAEPTAYDRVKAIESYLRRIPYTLDLPHPPLDRDLVDFFLFDLRQGYCDYYASAMVILARAAGIPARLAIGYANGIYDLNSQRFQVSEADAHSWVEVYFPSIGWVAFEPTAARPALTSPQGLGPTTPQDSINEMPADAGSPAVTVNGWLVLLSGLLVAGITGVMFIVRNEILLRRLPEAQAAGEVYRRMKRYAARLAAETGHGDTPYEYAAALGSRLQELSFYGKTPAFAADLTADLTTLTAGIVLASYHPSPPPVEEEQALYSQWRRLRWRLGLMRLVKGYNTIHDRLSGILADDGKKRTEADQEA
jgi:transglutaminase-like putative cysteine protease